MKYCKECGKQNEDKNKFCWKCGAKLITKLPAKESVKAKPAVTKTSSKAVVKKTSAKKSALKKTATKKPVAKKPVAVKPKKKEQTFNERKMAIYEMTPQDNCGDCGCKNCMQFAMQAASENNSMELSDCPYITEEEETTISNDTIPSRSKSSSSKPRCPNCGSQKLRIEKKPFRKGMLFLGVLGAAIEATRDRGKQYVCLNCGETWDVD